MRSTQRFREIVAYRRIHRLHRQRSDVVVVLLNVDRTLDSGLATILQGNGERYFNSSYYTMNHCRTCQALHHYKRNKQLGNSPYENLEWDFSKKKNKIKLTTAESYVDTVGVSFVQLAWLTGTRNNVNDRHFTRSRT